MTNNGLISHATGDPTFRLDASGGELRFRIDYSNGTFRISLDENPGMFPRYLHTLGQASAIEGRLTLADGRPLLKLGLGAESEQAGATPCRMSDAALTVYHDATEERIRATLISSSGLLTELAPRSHNIILLELARVRLEERARGVAADQEGWVHRDSLARRTGLTVEHINIMIHRVRNKLSSAGVEDWRNVVERDVGAGLLRLGPRQVDVVRA